MIKEIVTDPEVLATFSTDVEASPELIQDLKDTLAASPTGVGLAAIQIGSPVRAFAIKTRDSIEVYIDPEITSKSSKRITSIEQCLSFPDQFGIVERAISVCIKCRDEDSKPQIRTFKDYLALAVQHEIDHLNGITIAETSVIGLKYIPTSKIEAVEEAIEDKIEEFNESNGT